MVFTIESVKETHLNFEAILGANIQNKFAVMPFVQVNNGKRGKRNANYFQSGPPKLLER